MCISRASNIVITHREYPGTVPLLLMRRQHVPAPVPRPLGGDDFCPLLRS